VATGAETHARGKKKRGRIKGDEKKIFLKAASPRDIKMVSVESRPREPGYAKTHTKTKKPPECVFVKEIGGGSAISGYRGGQHGGRKRGENHLAVAVARIEGKD